MRALIYDGQFRYDSAAPEPLTRDDQVLLRIRRAGICNTDLELIGGYMGFSGILGHEFVGEVVHGPESWLGQRVVGEINIACTECDLCQRGMPSQCRNRVTVGIDRYPGAFADYLPLPIRNLHRVPHTISDDQAVFVEPLAAVLQVTEAVHISPGHRVYVLGIGKLGALAAQIVRLTGADVVGVVRREKQAALLREWGIPSAHYAELPQRRAQVVVDCTGTPEGFAHALNLVEPRGTVVLKSTYRKLPQADLTRVAVEEIRVIGSRCGPFDAALRLLGGGLIDVAPLIEARYPLSAGLQAFEFAAQPGALKVLLDF